MSYRDECRISSLVPVEGAEEDAYGQTEEERRVAYAGRCDIQDLSYGMRRSGAGDAALDGDAQVCFPGDRLPVRVRVEQEFEETTGRMRRGKVTDVSTLDGFIVVKWLSR